MFIRYVNNNIIIYHPYSLDGYQCGFENWELYQEIVYSWGWNKTICWTLSARYSYNIQHVKKTSLVHSIKVVGCTGVLVFSLRQLMEIYAIKVAFFIAFLRFTINHVYSVIWNQSPWYWVFYMCVQDNNHLLNTLAFI